MGYPFSQAEHDEAAGIGCAMLLGALFVILFVGFLAAVACLPLLG